MVGNWFVAALRNLLRSRTNALISLFGLFLGFVATILIALYVGDEYSYDRFFPEDDRIYQVGVVIRPPARAPVRISVAAVTDAAALKLAFPEIEAVTRLTQSLETIRPTGTQETATLVAYWVDPNFLQIFPLPSISGSLVGALSQPDTVVLTRKAARQLFGDGDPIGKTIDVTGRALDEMGRSLDVNRTDVMRVAAVVEDLPSNSHLNVEVFLPATASFSALSMREMQQSRPGAVRSLNVHTYVRLHPDASIERVRARLQEFVEANVTEVINGVRAASNYAFVLTPIADIHLSPPSLSAMKLPSDPRIVQAFMGVGLLILLVACGNFISMMTARATRRAIEVGVRKTAGATQRQIMAQFLGESLIYSALALVPAIVAVKLLLPAFNGFLQRQIAFDFGRDPYIAGGIVGLGVVVGLAAGFYPALYLSSFRPGVVLKGASAHLPRAARLRQGLVVFQFATLIALIVTTLTIDRQTQFAIEDRLRLPTDEIYLAGRPVSCSRSVTEMMRAVESIREASCASGSTLTLDQINTVVTSDAGPVSARAAAVDPEFFGMFDIELVAGRLLSTERGADDLLRNGNDVEGNPALVINESAVRALGFSSPDAAIGRFVRWTRLARIDGGLRMQEGASSEVVGVVRDFSIGSVRDVVEPTAYHLDPMFANVLVLKFKEGAIREGLEAAMRLWVQQSSAPFSGRFLSQFVNDLYSDIAMQSTILSIFSGIAVALASLGILGLAMFATESRTKEIGLRKVMGALRADVLRLLGWRFARPVLLANFIAWPVAYWGMTRWLEGFAYHVELGLIPFLVAGLMALAIALVSVAGHAVLVAKAKPIRALRHE